MKYFPHILLGGQRGLPVLKVTEDRSWLSSWGLGTAIPVEQRPLRPQKRLGHHECPQEAEVEFQGQQAHPLPPTLQDGKTPYGDGCEEEAGKKPQVTSCWERPLGVGSSAACLQRQYPQAGRTHIQHVTQVAAVTVAIATE